MTTATPTQATTREISSPLPSLKEGLAAFLRALDGRNKSGATIRAYRADISQFLTWLSSSSLVVHAPADVTRTDVTEYLAHLSQSDLSGVSRARKLAAIREFFRFLTEHGAIDKSPVLGIETPKKERNSRSWLRPDEYNQLLLLAAGNTRDHCILQVFLQTGLRVSELCNLRLQDVDLAGHTLTVTAGKGMLARDIDLERKGTQALKNWLKARPRAPYDHLFLNRNGEPLGERGVRKLLAKYVEQAGLTKKISPHSLRHSFATAKAEKGVTPFQLKEWLGHANLNTTQIYVHMGRQNSKKVMEATSL